MNKKPILYFFVALIAFGLVGIVLFKNTNSYSSHRPKIINLQALEKIAEAGDIEAQLRLVDFYKMNWNNAENYKNRENYWNQKLALRKNTAEYNQAVIKLEKERHEELKEQKERFAKKQKEVKALAEKYKNLDHADKQANDKARLEYLETLFDSTEVFSWKVPYIWRYRLTINIETPEGIKSGSAIQEIYYPPADKNIYAPSNQGIPHGEAVYIDLGQRGVVFAIMPDPSNSVGAFKRLITNVFPTVPRIHEQIRYPEILKHYNDLKNVKDEVPPEFYPKLVGFKDINNPKTIELVYQRKEGSIANMKQVETDRLEDFYGKGVKIKNMTLEMTDDPLEWKLGDKLSWIENMSEKEITRALAEAEPRIYITNGIGYYVFRQGFKKSSM